MGALVPTTKGMGTAYNMSEEFFAVVIHGCIDLKILHHTYIGLGAGLPFEIRVGRRGATSVGDGLTGPKGIILSLFYNGGKG